MAAGLRRKSLPQWQEVALFNFASFPLFDSFSNNFSYFLEFSLFWPFLVAVVAKLQRVVVVAVYFGQEQRFITPMKMVSAPRRTSVAWLHCSLAFSLF